MAGVLHVYLGYTAHIRINETVYFGENKKRINVILVWLIPLFWAMIIRAILNNPAYSAIKKKKRDKLNIEQDHAKADEFESDYDDY